MSHEIFIAYSRDDGAEAEALETYLTQEGFTCWRDVNLIRGSDRWVEAITEALTTCRACIVLASPNSVRSDHVGRELMLAVDQRKHIIPVFLSRDVEMTGKMLYYLTELQHIYAVPTKGVGLEEIIRALGGQTQPSSPPRRRRRIAWIKFLAFVRSRFLPICLLCTLLLAGYLVDRTWFHPLRCVAPGLGLYLVEAQSDASIDLYLGRHSALGGTAGLYVHNPRSTKTVRIGNGTRLIPSKRENSLHYISRLPRGEGSWASLFMWSKAQLTRVRNLTVSSGDATHLVLVLNSRHRDRLRVGMKDYTGHEAKVTVDVAEGWNVYAVPLNAFRPVDSNDLVLIQMAYEDAFALHDHLELEILDISFRRLKLPA